MVQRQFFFIFQTSKKIPCNLKADFSARIRRKGILISTNDFPNESYLLTDQTPAPALAFTMAGTFDALSAV